MDPNLAVFSFFFRSLTHLKVLDTLADRLHFSSALQAQDDRGLGRGIDSTETHHQVLEVETAARRTTNGRVMFKTLLTRK